MITTILLIMIGLKLNMFNENALFLVLIITKASLDIIDLLIKITKFGSGKLD